MLEKDGRSAQRDLVFGLSNSDKREIALGKCFNLSWKANTLLQKDTDFAEVRVSVPAC